MYQLEAHYILKDVKAKEKSLLLMHLCIYVCVCVCLYIYKQVPLVAQWSNIHLPRSHPWVGKIPQRRKRQPTAVFLPGEFHGQRGLAGYSGWGCKSWTQLSD